MRWIAVLICLVAISAAGARAQGRPVDLDRPLAAGALDRAEARYLQAALAWAGFHDGTLDGVWGPRSEGALARAARERFDAPQARLRHVARLVRAFGGALAREGWAPFHDVTAGLSYQVPGALLSRESRSRSVAWRAAGGTLELASSLESIWDTMRLHEHFMRRSPGAAGFEFPQRDRVVNAGRLAGSQRSFYLQSRRRDIHYASVVIQWQPEQANIARLIAASIADGPQPALALPEGGLLARAVAALDRKPPAPAPVPGGAPVTLSLAGAGVYVNNTDIVTDAGLLRGCAALRLQDGTRLSPLAARAGAGLAVLTSARRSDHWLTLGRRAQAEQGGAVAILGFAGYRRGATGPERSGGQVAGEHLFGNADLRPVILTGSWSGLQGAPVFDRQERLIGVVSSAGKAGGYRALPGHVLMTPAERLAGILWQRGILYQRAAPPRKDGRNRPERAVVPLFCAQ